MSTTETSRTIVVIDTNSYSGNFEQEIAAYTIGASSEYTRAESILNQVPDEVIEMFDDTTDARADDHGNYCPWSIWFGPKGDKYNSVALFFMEMPTPEMLTVIQTRAKEFCKANKIKFLGGRVLSEVTTVTEIQESKF